MAKVDLVDIPEPIFVKGDDTSMLQEALSHLQDLSVRQPRLGQRHNRIWLCAVLCEAGIGIDTAKELLAAVSALWDKPKTQQEVSEAVRQAYSG